MVVSESDGGAVCAEGVEAGDGGEVSGDAETSPGVFAFYVFYEQGQGGLR